MIPHRSHSAGFVGALVSRGMAALALRSTIYFFPPRLTLFFKRALLLSALLLRIHFTRASQALLTRSN